jgi:hypothetical protein
LPPTNRCRPSRRASVPPPIPRSEDNVARSRACELSSAGRLVPAASGCAVLHRAAGLLRARHRGQERAQAEPPPEPDEDACPPARLLRRNRRAAHTSPCSELHQNQRPAAAIIVRPRHGVRSVTSFRFDGHHTSRSRRRGAGSG